jgi:hypothetical protein
MYNILPLVLTACLFATTILAKKGEGDDKLPRHRDHKHDVCVDICNKAADGDVQWNAVCNSCIHTDKAALDQGCRDCSRKCRYKHESEHNMWYCNMCFEKGVNPFDWDGEW